MPDARPARVPLAVRGVHRGAELSGAGWVELGETELAVSVTRPGAAHERRIAIPYDAIDGARLDDGQLTLFLGSGAMLELTGSPHVAALAGELDARICAFPELTLRLRALGSGRAYPGSDHDRFFAPLLAARRVAERQGSPADAVVAFDAAGLREAVERTLADLAAERFPESPPDRRALEAELDEVAERLVASLDALGTAAREVTAGSDDVRFARWRMWAAVLQHSFDEADRCWIAALPALCDSRGQRGRFWRRVLKLGIAVALALPAAAGPVAGCL